MIKCPTREEVLAAELPVEVHQVSRFPSGDTAPCVHRFRTQEDADKFLSEEARVLRNRPKEK